MPMVKIELLEGRTDEMLEELVTEVTNATAKTLQIDKENVDVVIREVQSKHWAKGGNLLKYRQ